MKNKGGKLGGLLIAAAMLGVAPAARAQQGPKDRICRVVNETITVCTAWDYHGRAPRCVRWSSRVVSRLVCI